jgi:hypothetical protein
MPKMLDNWTRWDNLKVTNTNTDEVKELPPKEEDKEDKEKE